MAKLIGPSHRTGSCEELSDDERTTIEDILTTAAEEISECGGDLERRVGAPAHSRRWEGRRGVIVAVVKRAPSHG